MVPRRNTSEMIRRATSNDADAILQLVDALADYESLPRPSAEAKKRLSADMGNRFDAWIAEVEGAPAGYAFAFETYSSFLALPSLYLEDLFVLPEYRSRKVGLALFNEVLEEAKRRGCGRMEWTVLDWNELAINFYKRAGATHLKEWHHYRIVL
jgi:GNAT superfamily N-acetyltransferase